MADYCTTADVTAELTYITISGSTTPSTDQVTQFCTDITADMDARMRAVGIDTPVTDSGLLPVLKPVAINGVKAKVLRALNIQDGDQERAGEYEQLYQDAMQRIERQPAIIRSTDTPGEPEGVPERDIAFSRGGAEW